VATNIHLDQSSPLGSNGLHCVKFPHHMGKLLLNLAPGEPLSLVKKLPYFDNPVELYVLLVGAFHLCIHDSINCILLKEVRVELCRGQVLSYL
jgi:hypothetical protein